LDAAQSSVATKERRLGRSSPRSNQRIEIAPPNKPALIVFSTNPLGDPIILVNDQRGRKRFGITLDENGNAIVEWFASDGRTLKRLSVP